MRLNQSEYLLSQKDKLKQLIQLLDSRYQYASVLATDVTGMSYMFSQKRSSIAPNNFSERGFVVRVYKDGVYQEYSFNEIEDVNKTFEMICQQLDKQDEMLKSINVAVYPTELIQEEKIEKEFASCQSDTILTTTKKQIMDKIKAISDQMVKREGIIECQVRYNHNVINKMFLSKNKDLIQSYSYSLAAVVPVAFKNGKTNVLFTSASSTDGLELFDQVEKNLDETYNNLMRLFEATNIEPGEYEVICTPEAAGLIAHEAFGHGLEMDMFVKNRAVAKEHMQEKIASSITNMYDGTDKVTDSASYFFDDEGVISGTTAILENGYLKNGMSDTLSALRLNVKPSGNGRRESYKRKAYTRMTNTYFGSGTSSLDEMIKSTKYGFLISDGQSGIEDPKHWGIQCVLSTAQEIKDGQLTGKVFTPVVLTGYVPDLLANISMVAGEVKTNGNGMCGKGYKEWVVVSDGGPYIKTKVRLG
ncbi:MAG: TldD/PmbA family protein [Erysipelotrichaceae bacterium]